MRSESIFAAMSSLALTAMVSAAPEVLHGQGATGAPAGGSSSQFAAFDAKFSLSPTTGFVSFSGVPTQFAAPVKSERELGSSKQVKSVQWSFTLEHSVSDGFSLTMTGIRNDERSATTRTIRWSGNPTGNSLGQGGGLSGVSFNSLQLTGLLPQGDGANGLSFADMAFTSATLGNGAFADDELTPRGPDHANVWMTFGNGEDLRMHDWSLSGMVSGFRSSDAGGGDVSFSISGQSVTLVPLPAAAWAGLSTLTAVGLLGAIRRRRRLA